jgi:NADPH:quinone reductase-like Zn-dependent oxidoreductase
MAGARAPDLSLDRLLGKRLHIMGTMLRARPLEEKIAAMRAFARHVVPLLAAGDLRPVVDKVLPLEKAGEAHAYMAGNEGFGKVVLET